MNRVHSFMVVFILLTSVIVCSLSTRLGRRNPSKKVNVIQTWKTQTIPHDCRRFQQKILELHDTNYVFFDDEAMYAFVEKEYASHWGYFKSMKIKIQQIDMFRYLAVHFFGGLYLDLDMDLYTRSIDWNILGSCCFPMEFESNGDDILRKRGFSSLIGQYAFYADRGHPFMMELADNIVRNKYGIHEEDYPDTMRYVLYRTGPVHVTLTYLDTKHDVRVISPRPFKNSKFGQFAGHVSVGTWK